MIGAPTRQSVATVVIGDNPELMGQMGRHGIPLPLTSCETVNEHHGRPITTPVCDRKSCVIPHERALHFCHVCSTHSGSGTVNPTSLPHVLR